MEVLELAPLEKSSPSRVAARFIFVLPLRITVTAAIVTKALLVPVPLVNGLFSFPFHECWKYRGVPFHS